jgi:quercetin dioxygenase-like cupin family protein
VQADRLTRGFMVPAGSGLPHEVRGVMASGQSTNGAVTVMEITIDTGPPRHIHTREHESLYLLRGDLDVECGNERFRAGPGSFVFLPREVPHRFRAVGGSATALLVVTPGGLDEYFAQTARPRRRRGSIRDPHYPGCLRHPARLTPHQPAQP